MSDPGSVESPTTEVRKAQPLVPGPTVIAICFFCRHFFVHFAPGAFWKAATSPVVSNV